MGLIIDLFAGAGGWDWALRELGREAIGLEWDGDACATRAELGYPTIRCDIEKYPTEPFVGKVTGLIASPPCTDFSNAGKRAGLMGDSGRLVYEVLRWVDDLRPEWVACEQVPEALPYWQDFADQFRLWGYSTWCGVLNAADFGVPQTRRRAILMASRVKAVYPPEPTHAKYPKPRLDGIEEQRWTSMADALGWGAMVRPCVTVTAGGTDTGGAAPIAHVNAFRERERERESWLSKGSGARHD